MGCGGPGLYYQNAALQTEGATLVQNGGHDAAVSGRDAGDKQRPRRERKASTRYQGEDFASLEDARGLGSIEDQDGAAAASVGGGGGGGGGQHGGESSRVKTNEVASSSTLILPQRLMTGSALDCATGAVGAQDDVFPSSRSREGFKATSFRGKAGKGSQASSARGQGGVGHSAVGGVTAADQLELFLTHSRVGVAPAGEGPSAAHYHLLRNGGCGYPTRTSSPATAALAAAAALAMEEHEAEMMAKAKSGGGKSGAVGSTMDNGMLSDPLEALFPATGGVDASLTRRSSASAVPRPHTHHPHPNPRGGGSGGSNGLGPSVLSPVGVSSLLGLGSPSSSGVAGGLGMDASGLARPQSGAGLPIMPSLSQQHNQYLLASLGLEGRLSPFTAALVRGGNSIKWKMRRSEFLFRDALLTAFSSLFLSIVVFMCGLVAFRLIQPSLCTLSLPDDHD